MIRQFRPEKLHKPRNFIKPSISTTGTYAFEIGAGKGMHAISLAKREPETTLFAVERTKEKYTAFAKRADAACLANLHAIHADAVAWTVHALPPCVLSRVFIFYPNPEANNPNQRWLNMPFFEFLLSRMCSQATVVLASNIPTYIDECVQQLTTVWRLPFDKSIVPKDSARTHFEVKYLAREELCWQLTITKPKTYNTRFDDWQTTE